MNIYHWFLIYGVVLCLVLAVAAVLQSLQSPDDGVEPGDD